MSGETGTLTYLGTGDPLVLGFGSNHSLTFRLYKV